MRANLLSSVVVAPGPPASRMPGSAGAEGGRARDDGADGSWFVDNWVDGVGFVVFAVVAIAVMATISPLVTVFMVVPLAAVGGATRLLSARVRRYHRAERASGAAVTSFVADIFASVVTVKAAGAEDAAIQRFRTFNRTRADAAVKSQLAQDLLITISGGSVEI